MSDIFTQLTLLAALAVVVVQQILKLKVVPVSFANKYPVATNVVLSVVASAVVVVKQGVIHLISWIDWLQLAGLISILAAITYNVTIANSGLKKYEGRE